MSDKSWQQELIDTVISLDRKLKDAKAKIGSNPNIIVEYDFAVTTS